MIAKAKRNIASWQDICLFFRVFLLIAVLPARIKWHTLPGLLQWLTPETQKPPTDVEIDVHRKKIVKHTDFILGWGFGVWQQTCLKRSLVLYHFLRSIGMPVQICFGIRPSAAEGSHGIQGQLEGHAWLRYDKDLFLEIDPDMTNSYTETYRYPSGQDQIRGSGSSPMMGSERQGMLWKKFAKIVCSFMPCNICKTSRGSRKPNGFARHP